MEDEGGLGVRLRANGGRAGARGWPRQWRAAAWTLKNAPGGPSDRTGGRGADEIVYWNSEGFTTKSQRNSKKCGMWAPKYSAHANGINMVHLEGTLREGRGTRRGAGRAAGPDVAAEVGDQSVRWIRHVRRQQLWGGGEGSGGARPWNRVGSRGGCNKNRWMRTYFKQTRRKSGEKSYDG